MWDTLFDRMLGSFLRDGTMITHLQGGRILRHGDGKEPVVTIRITDPGLTRRMVLQPDLAVGESYMNGDFTIDGDDLHGFLALMTRNLLRGAPVWWQEPVFHARRLLRRLGQFNPLARSQSNVAHHYDLSGKLYDLFLDADRQYSCAYFRHPDDTLEQAQINKKAHIAGKLRLQPGMTVLDIGCGWGGMAITLARDYGARVVGVTLSTEQHKVATERAAAAGLSDRVEFRLMDYRHVTGTFDRIVSVGMFEHVGVPHYREYFAKVRNLLAPDGVALIHTIGRAAPPHVTNPWVLKYIFPGGYVPALSEVMAPLEKERIWPTDVEIWRLHYAETLRHWHDRFMANIAEVREIYDERFCRMWRYYLIASEMSFRYGRQCVFQLQLAHDQRAVPLTRDYLYVAEPEAAIARAAE